MPQQRGRCPAGLPASWPERVTGGGDGVEAGKASSPREGGGGGGGEAGTEAEPGLVVLNVTLTVNFLCYFSSILFVNFSL